MRRDRNRRGGRRMTGYRSVTVETAVGSYSVAFSPNHHIGAVLGEVLSRMGRPLSDRAGDYQLVDETGDPLDLDTTVAAAGVEDGDTLVLDANPRGGAI